MKRTIALFGLLFFLPFAANASGSEEPVPVEELDLERYQGTWHELASMPQEFARDCVGHAQANYEILANGLVKVLNSCEIQDGTRRVAEARARVNPMFNEVAKLQVTFANVGGNWLWQAAGNYWVLDLGQNYEYAVVGDPTRDYAWILSRTESVPVEKLEMIANGLLGQGYDVCRLEMTTTNEQRFPAENRPNLCQFLNW